MSFIYVIIETNKGGEIFQLSKTDKNTRILLLYDALLNGNSIDKKTFSVEHCIDERTFDRDIEDIRLFLSESFSCRELIYDKEINAYQLSGNQIKSIDRMEATVISKILLESGLLREDEILGLINSLLSAVTSRDKLAIKKYLSPELKQYESKTNLAILKFVEDLFEVIDSGHDITITFAHKNGRVIKNISPIAIKCRKKEFVLVAAENFDLKNMIEIKINDILHFEILHSIYAKTIKEKYYGGIKNGKG